MRTYTLAFSIVVHAFIVGALIVAPIVANNELPEPRRAVEFIEVRPVTAPVIPPPRGAGAHRPKSFNPLAAPIVAPEQITPETPIEPFEAEGIPDGVIGGVPEGVVGSILSTVPDAPPPPAPKPVTPIQIGGLIKRPERIRYVPPIYPSLALAAHKEGTVILEAVIAEDGRVRNLRVLRSIPLLDSAAIDAVRQWQFTPTLLNNQPVPVMMTVTVTFTLQR